LTPATESITHQIQKIPGYFPDKREFWCGNGFVSNLLQYRQKVLAKAPSTRDPKRTLELYPTRCRCGSEAFPNAHRITLAARINKVTLDFWATLNDPTRLDDLSDLDVPTLVVSGGRSPFPTRRICFHLAPTLPDVKQRMIDEGGHMLPSSHFKEIAPLIRFHCDARNHLKSESETILRARACA
jgi:pimeloyl-ACP methyl ester carboxylesterase